MAKIPVLNINEVEYEDWGDGGRFQAKLGPLAKPLGAQKLGYRMVILPPGKTGWPFHYHRVNEEMFFILEGKGVLRYGEKMYAVKPGDVIACPPGKDRPHQLTNTSSEPMRYLAVSTKESPEVAGYPDSGKYGVFIGDGEELEYYIGKEDEKISYWEGES